MLQSTSNCIKARACFLTSSPIPLFQHSSFSNINSFFKQPQYHSHLIWNRISSLLCAMPPLIRSHIKNTPKLYLYIIKFRISWICLFSLWLKGTALEKFNRSHTVQASSIGRHFKRAATRAEIGPFPLYIMVFNGKWRKSWILRNHKRSHSPSLISQVNHLHLHIKMRKSMWENIMSFIKAISLAAAMTTQVQIPAHPEPWEPSPISLSS